MPCYETCSTFRRQVLGLIMACFTLVMVCTGIFRNVGEPLTWPQRHIPGDLNFWAVMLPRNSRRQNVFFNYIFYFLFLFLLLSVLRPSFLISSTLLILFSSISSPFSPSCSSSFSSCLSAVSSTHSASYAQPPRIDDINGAITVLWALCMLHLTLAYAPPNSVSCLW